MGLKIKRKTEIEDASCDFCGADLRCYFDCKADSPNINCAVLEHQFGYGSRLDSIEGEMFGLSPKHYLCEDCYEKALELKELE